MEYSGLLIINLIIMTLLPIGTTIVLYLPKFKTVCEKLPILHRNILYGIIYGFVSALIVVLGTTRTFDNNIISYAVDAPPIIAGLLFDFPAGIIAGVIGGVVRFSSILWAGESSLRVICSLGVLAAGIFATLLRRFIFKDENVATVIHGIFFALVIEIINFTMFFFSINNVDHFNNMHAVFRQIQDLVIPTMLTVVISVTLSLFLSQRMNQEKDRDKRERLIRAFEKYMLGMILLSLGIMVIFVVLINNKTVQEDYSILLSNNIRDLQENADEMLNDELIKTAQMISKDDLKSTGNLSALAQKYDVSEINIIERNRNINSNIPDNIGFDMLATVQSREFMKHLIVEKKYVQAFMPMGQDAEINKKYAGIHLEGDTYLQVGYDAKKFQKVSSDHIDQAVKYCHIGQEGQVIVLDLSGQVVAGNSGLENLMDVLFQEIQDEKLPLNTMSRVVLGGEDYTWMYDRSDEFYFLALIPTSEVVLSRNFLISSSLFIGIIIFFILFALLHVLLKRIVINDIDRVNMGLSRITDGHLNTSIEVRSNQEFDNLSDGINAMVSSLKQLISEASTRYAKDLDYAKIIQMSSLPDYQSFEVLRPDIRLYASMTPAEDVGGDFYDFYSIDNDRFVICIADVSGKSIPAAMFMMRVKTLLRSLMEKNVDIKTAFEETNHQICETNKGGMFVTVWMGVWDTRKGVLTFVNAGHKSPLFCRYGGAYQYLKTAPNLVIGIMDGIEYNIETVDFRPGDRIFLYTDGVTEANNENRFLFEEDRLLEALNQSNVKPNATIEDNCRAVQTALNDFVGNAKQFDDITMLGISAVYLWNKDSAIFSGSFDSIQYLPQFLDGCSERHNIPQKTAFSIQVCADEIVSNNIRYSKAKEIHVNYSIENNTVVLDVRNNGVLFNPLSVPVPDINVPIEDRKIGGLGLLMVRKMTRSFSYTDEDGWNYVRMVFDFEK